MKKWKNLTCVNYIIKQRFYNKNHKGLRERNNNRKNLTKHITHHSKIENTKNFKRIKKIHELPLFSKFVTTVLIFATASSFFQHGIYRWQSDQFLLGTPLKTRVTTQKQPLGLFWTKKCSQKCCKFHGKTPALKSFFNRLAGL